MASTTHEQVTTRTRQQRSCRSYSLPSVVQIDEMSWRC